MTNTEHLNARSGCSFSISSMSSTVTPFRLNFFLMRCLKFSRTKAIVRARISSSDSPSSRSMKADATAQKKHSEQLDQSRRYSFPQKSTILVVTLPMPQHPLPPSSLTATHWISKKLILTRLHPLPV